jgi:hypothetical protein
MLLSSLLEGFLSQMAWETNKFSRESARSVDLAKAAEQRARLGIASPDLDRALTRSVLNVAWFGSSLSSYRISHMEPF